MVFRKNSVNLIPNLTASSVNFFQYTSIRWEFTYHNKNTVVIGGFSQKGKEVVFHCDDTDYCGQNISFTAYIGDKNEGAQLEVFHHNRFRWFDKEIVEKELNIRQYVPYKMDQGGSSLCGVAVVGYFWSKMCFKEYKKMILSLFQKGEACIHTTKFCLTIDQDEHLLKYKKTDRQYPKQSFDNNPIEEIDFIFLLTIRDYFNKIWDYEPDEENAGGFVEGGTGLTSPREIEKMFKKINGYKTVRDETNLITSKWGKTSELISELKSLYAEKYAIAMLINSDGFESNKKSLFSIPNHWVGLINIVDYPKTEEVECYVFTWGHIKNGGFLMMYLRTLIMGMFRENRIMGMLKAEIYIFAFFIVFSLVFYWIEPAHELYNKEGFEFSILGLFAFLAIIIKSIFFWILLIYPVFFILRFLFLLIRKKLRIYLAILCYVLIMYMLSCLCLFGLFSINKKEKIKERKHYTYIIKNTSSFDHDMLCKNCIKQESIYLRCYEYSKTTTKKERLIPKKISTFMATAS